MNLAPVNRLYKITVMQDSKNNAVAQSLNNRMGAVAASTGRVTKNARGAALATRNLGYVAQNASYQIADFFVMLQGGVGIGRALSTQLPQLLAGFGKMGAVLGAVAAIGATVVVMLKNKSAVTKDLTGDLEKYTDAWDDAIKAQFAAIESGKASAKVLYQVKLAALEVEQANIGKILAPPDPSAWRGFLTVWKDVISEIAGFVANIPGIKQVLQILDAAAASFAKNFNILKDQYADLDAVTNASRRSLEAFVGPLVNAQLGTETFARTLNAARSELNGFNNSLSVLPPGTAFPILDDAVNKVQTFSEIIGALYGSDIEKWPKRYAEVWEDLQEQLKLTKEEVLPLANELYDLTAVQSNGLFQELFRETDLAKEIRKWDEALDQGIVSLGAANAAKDALTKIEPWKEMQDIIIDIGKSFEDNIINSMKTGKFAVKDFINFALEQFARLALSKVFEPFFLLIANSIPGLGGGASGSPSPGTGVPGFAFRTIEPPQSAAPMYNYGESISRVPGASRNLDGGSGNVTVNVNNYGKDEVEVKQSNTGNGIEIDVLIKETVKQGFGGGDFDSSLATTFGLRRLGY
jgi:hypothetical protein